MFSFLEILQHFFFLRDTVLPSMTPLEWQVNSVCVFACVRACLTHFLLDWLIDGRFFAWKNAFNLWTLSNFFIHFILEKQTGKWCLNASFCGLSFAFKFSVSYGLFVFSFHPFRNSCVLCAVTPSLPHPSLPHFLTPFSFTPSLTHSLTNSLPH